MNNRAADAPRKEVKMYDPDVVVIIGLGTDDGPSHPLFDGASNGPDGASRSRHSTAAAARKPSAIVWAESQEGI